MRTLNRPMFRYGGPIKEGVMHGIREPKRNGGSMSQLVQPSSTGVRPGYKGPKSFLMSKVPFLANTYNRGLANLKKIPGYLQSKMGKNVTTGSGTTTVGGKVVQTAGSGTKYVPSYLGRDPLVKLVGGTYKIVTDPRAKGFAKKGVQYATSPTALLAGATFTDVLPGGNPFIGDRNILGQKFDKETGIKTEGLFGRDLPAKAELEKIETDRIAKAEADEQARLKALYEVQNPEIREPKKSEEEIRKERIQKYRDIMDIKGMNKNAAYDSLIAASQAVLGADDLKGSLKDGSLINKIIGSTSKAFDKPSKTKDAIDTLILKGEIEKDISLAKGNSSTQQLAALSAASGKSPKFVANAKLGIANTPGEAKSQLVKLKKGTVTSDDVTAVIVSYGEDNGIPFKKQITTEQKNEQVGKGKKFASVTELINSLSLDPNGADDGLYVVGTSVVEVDKGIPKLRG